MKKFKTYRISDLLPLAVIATSLAFVLFQWLRYFKDFDDFEQGELISFIIFIGGYCLILVFLVVIGWCLHQTTIFNTKWSNKWLIDMAIYCLLFVTFFLAISRSLSDQEQYLPENMLLTCIGVIVVWASQKLFDSSRQKQLRLVSEKEKKQAELNTIKAQVNPHFLFNALNTLYSDALKINASDMLMNLEKLTDILRYQLASSSLKGIPLEAEIDFIHQFVTFQQHRLKSNPKIQVNIKTAIKSSGLVIQPMILIALIENAFKHGISHDEKSRININLEEKEGQLSLGIENTNRPKTGKSSSGIGLAQTNKLLQAYYPSYKLDTYLKNDLHFTHLHIHLNSQP